ncbi:alpha/beta hydrolase [Photobacterium makurazakiensis]|uniref:alpha/beta fold hydrolase n=1 Tax=Photobacterium makurazakiensis TaxID=2910234 RepID=UPI003D0C86EE
MNQSVPLLWLPGLLCDHHLFTSVNQRLADNVDPQCAVLTADESMQVLAAKVLEDAPERFILGGLSMGGILAFEVYRQAPERVAGLILIGTNAADEKMEITLKRNSLVEKAVQGAFSMITPEILMPLLIHPSRLNDPSLTSTVTLMAEHVGLNCFMAHANALATRPDARPLLASIAVPTLIICGRDDLLCPVSNHLLMAEQIPDVSLHILNNCGHLTTMEQPERVAHHINAWLSVNNI